MPGWHMALFEYPSIIMWNYFVIFLLRYVSQLAAIFVTHDVMFHYGIRVYVMVNMVKKLYCMRVIKRNITAQFCPINYFCSIIYFYGKNLYKWWFCIYDMYNCIRWILFATFCRYRISLQHPFSVNHFGIRVYTMVNTTCAFTEQNSFYLLKFLKI